MEPLEAILALPAARKLLLASISALVMMSLGAVAYDRAPVFGPHAKIERLRGQLSDVAGRLKSARDLVANREAARASCEALRVTERDHGADSITEGAQRASQGSTAAFNAGYSAGKTAGRTACPTGDTNAPTDPASDPVADVVRDQDLAGAFNVSVYRPGGPVPARN